MRRTAVHLALGALLLVGCADTYKIDKQIVDDIKDGLLVDYGRIQGRLDARCGKTSDDPVCVEGRAHLRKLADGYRKLKAAKKDGTLDPEMLKEVLPLITTVAPLFLVP